MQDSQVKLGKNANILAHDSLIHIHFKVYNFQTMSHTYAKLVLRRTNNPSWDIRQKTTPSSSYSYHSLSLAYQIFQA